MPTPNKHRTHFASTILLLLVGCVNVWAQQGDAEFASYSAELFSNSSSRRVSAPTTALELEAASPKPRLVSPPTTPTSAVHETVASASAEQPIANFASSDGIADFDFAPTLDTKNLLTKLAAGIVLSVSLCFGIIFLGSKFSNQNGFGNAGGDLELVDTLHVGQRCFLQLVKAQDQLVIVGRDAGGISQITPLTATFQEKLDDVDRETLEFEQAAAALLAQKGVTGWKQTSRKR